MSASVVICAYSSDRFGLLCDAIRSVLRQTHKDREVVVVIDHNPDLLAKVAEEFPEIRTMPNEGARGLSDARNTGMRLCTKDIIAFLDDDATAEADWLERLVRHYGDPDILAVGGGIVPAWPVSRPV